MAAERSRQREPNAVMLRCDLGDQARKVLLHVTSSGQHERVHDDERCPLLDAARKALLNRRLRDLHVSRLDDGAFPHARLHAADDFAQELVGFATPAAVVNQENGPHVADLGLHSVRVNLGVGGYRSLDASHVRPAE